MVFKKARGLLMEVNNISPSQLAEIAAYEDEPKSSSAQFDTRLRVLSKKLVDNKAWRKKELL
jgi:hypothetical protein